MIKGSKITKKSATYYTTLSNAYSLLEELLANPSPQTETQTNNQRVLPKHHSIFKIKAAHRLQTKFEACIAKMNENNIIDLYINKEEDERTALAKITSRTQSASQSTQTTQPQAIPSQSMTSYIKERMLATHFQPQCAY